jgi:hypothetical protein
VLHGRSLFPNTQGEALADTFSRRNLLPSLTRHTEGVRASCRPRAPRSPASSLSFAPSGVVSAARRPPHSGQHLKRTAAPYKRRDGDRRLGRAEKFALFPKFFPHVPRSSDCTSARAS